MFSSFYFSRRHDKPLSWVVLRGEVCSVGPGFTSLSLSHLAITSITLQNHNTTQIRAISTKKEGTRVIIQ